MWGLLKVRPQKAVTASHSISSNSPSEATPEVPSDNVFSFISSEQHYLASFRLKNTVFLKSVCFPQ
jgi:hypothetical protein